ncbi:hypothetical protein JOQ06_028227 [Pogonophryne albipinna]|uniref:Uncharacterized protein n=1 Tax=Pogonophryne albipinna TaxID=1090488 RepID=A0AAD6FLL1_9TELE|nr:hypothetical protein JOQ06_028227 [Pogonophryne albipinna]
MQRGDHSVKEPSLQSHTVACAPPKAISQALSRSPPLPLSLSPTLSSSPDSPWQNARDTAVKITGLFHGNTEEEGAGLVGREAETKQRPSVSCWPAHSCSGCGAFRAGV